MNILELTILYLACGAPFAVYSVFNQQLRVNILKKAVWAILTILFWIPFALLLSRGFVTKKLKELNKRASKPGDPKLQTRIASLESLIAEILYRGKGQFSVFEVRELLGRYVGLTLETRNQEAAQTDEINELFGVADHPDSPLASACLNRRNRLRLKQHQMQARSELLHLFSVVNALAANKNEFLSAIAEFAELIGDQSMKNLISNGLSSFEQTSSEFVVNEKESEQWSALTTKPQYSPSMNLNLPIS